MRSVNTVRNTFLKSSLSILFRLLHFPVPRFPPLQSGAAFSSPAFSTPCSLVPRFPLPRFPPLHFCYSRVFQSRVFSAPNLSIAVLWRFCCWYITLRCDIDFDLWPWTFAVYRLWRDETLYQIWRQSSYPRRNYCDFSVWPNDLEHMLRVALGSWIIFTTFDLRQLIRARIIAFLCW